MNQAENSWWRNQTENQSNLWKVFEFAINILQALGEEVRPLGLTTKVWACCGLEKRFFTQLEKELSFEQNLALAIELLNEEYVKKGYPVQIDVHRGKNNNDHLHAIAADRRLINGAWDEQKPKPFIINVERSKNWTKKVMS